MKPIAAKNMPDAGLTSPLTRDLLSQPTHPTMHNHANRAATSHAMLIVASNRQLRSRVSPVSVGPLRPIATRATGHRGIPTGRRELSPARNAEASWANGWGTSAISIY